MNRTTAMHNLSGPCQAERDASDVPDNMRGIGGTPGHFGFQSPGNLIHVNFQAAWTPRNRSDFENGIDSLAISARQRLRIMPEKVVSFSF